MPESTITWKFKETLTPFTNAQGYKEAVYIRGAMSDANENNIKSIVFDASGVMTYVYANGDSAEIYNNSKTSAYLRGNTYVSYPSDYIVIGAYDATNDVFRDISGVIIPARTNAIYCDENGLGVYKYNGIYNQLLDDLHDYVIVSIDDKLFVISTPAKADFSQYDNGYSSDHSLRVDIKNILNDVSTQTNAYFLYYVDDVVEGKYTLHFANYYQYTHYMTSDDNERLITLVGDDYVDFYSMNANTKDWLLKNAEFNTEGITFTSKKSLISVANTIRKQVGDYNDEEDEWSQSHQYYYPDAEGTDETFIKKIERLNNTYIHTNNNPASEDNVLEGKSYWRDGEEHIGTMPNQSDWGGHAITSVHQKLKVPKGYHDGTGYVIIKTDDQNKIISENIKNGITILGVDGKRSVIETNPNDDNNWNNRVAAPANRIVRGYSAYLNGNIIDGTLPRHTDEYESINNKMYPIDSGVNISSTEGLINRELSFIWGQTTSDTLVRGELTAYPAETKYYMTFDEVANRNIVSRFDPMRGRIDSKISDNLSKFPIGTYILGYQGTMRSIVTDQKINDVGSVEVDSSASIVHYIIDNGAYFNSDVAIYANYNQIVNAYNSDNLTKNRMIPENIKYGSTLFGVGGKPTVIDVKDTTATDSTVFVGRKFYDKDGNLRIGTMPGAFAVKVLQRDSNIPKARFMVKVGDTSIDTDNETMLQAPIDAEITLRIYSLGTTPANFFIKDLSKPLEEQVVASGGNNTTGTTTYSFTGVESYEIKCYAELNQITGLRDYFISFKPYGSVVDVCPQTTATADDVLVGKQFYNRNGQLTSGNIANNGDVSAVISTKSQTVAVPAGYTSGGEVSIAQSEQNKIMPSNIRSGSTILGVSGNYSGNVTVVNATNQGGYDNVFVNVTPTGNILKGSAVKVSTQKEPSTSSSITWWRLYIDGVLTGGLSGSDVSEDDKGKRDIGSYSDDIVVNADTEVVATAVFPGGLDVNVNKSAYSGTTATASDVLDSKYFYLENGIKTQGALSLSDNKSITNNGVYDAASDGKVGFKKVTVNVPIWGNACRLLNNGSDNQYVAVEGQRYYTKGDEFAVGDSGVEFYVEDATTVNPFRVYFFHEDDLEPYQSETVTDPLYNWQPTGDFEVSFSADSFEVRVYSNGGIDISDTTATADKVLSGYDFYLANGTKTTGTIDEANITASASITDVNNCLTSTQTSFALGYGATVTATTSGWVDAGSLGGDGGARYIKESDFQSNQSISTKADTISISEGYTVGGTVGISSTEQAKIIASNIKSGVTILGVTGTYAPSSGGYSCLIISSDQTLDNQYVCVSGNGFTDYYSQTNNHFVASTLSCRANYGPSGTNHVYFNSVEQTLDSEGICTIQLVANVNVTISGTPGSGATITITNV